MTKDNGWDVSPSWQELRDERDALAGTVRAYKQSFNNLSADCDSLARRIEKTERAVREMRDERNAAVDRANALAAHVERIRKEWYELTDYVSYETLLDTMEDLFNDTPTTSLVRLKAEWQAEALEEFGNLLESQGFAGSHGAWDRAEKLRRQASGDDS